MSLPHRVLYRGVPIVEFLGEAGYNYDCTERTKKALGHGQFTLEHAHKLDAFNSVVSADWILRLHADAEQFTDQVLLSCARTLPVVRVWSGELVVFETSDLKEGARIDDLRRVMDRPYQTFTRNGEILANDDRVYGGVKAGRIEVIE